MNGNELADKIERSHHEDWFSWLEDAAAMLRKLKN